MRKWLFFMFLLVLTAFAIMDCAPATGGYGMADYLNILFCNTKQYPVYDRSVWQIINLLFFLAVLNTGVYFLSESHYSFSKGFRSLVLIRYEKTSRYLTHIIKFSFCETFKFVGFIIVDCFLILLVVDTGALTFASHLVKGSPLLMAVYVVLYVLKIVLFYTWIQILMSYFLMRFSYEPILIGSLMGTSLLLYLDIQFGWNFVTIALNYDEIFYVCAYTLFLLLAGLLVNRKMKEKEM